jgi:biotin-dependent carboxylase-like uncharacterized protein
MRQITVLRPGLLTTVQDRGRWGWQAMGVPVGGPMDEWSFRLAALRVGNDEGAAGLEITLQGPQLRFDGPALVAVTGARFDLTLDARAVSTGEVCRAGAGSVLTFGERREGARAYLAIDGGIVTPPVFGSRATHLASGIGGLEGRALRAGDVLPVGPPGGRPRFRPAADHLPQGGSSRVRLLPGPEHDWFTGEALDVLARAEYTILPTSNRMGYRLSGPALSHGGRADIISDAVSFGSIQVPADGQPLLLMADRQTSGGYPRIGTVISADLGLAAQLAPGDTLSFAWCEPRDALAALIELEQAFL